MKNTIAFLAAALLLCACGSRKNVQPATSTTEETTTRLQDSLAFSLCQLYGLDQLVRPNGPGKLDWDVIHHADSVTFVKLVAFVREHGFPTEPLVGKRNMSHECVAMAAFAILLHNPHRLVNESNYMELFIGEVRKGNLKAETLATILDKYYWSKKGNQHRVLYGSQFGMPCLDTKEASNAARARIGLAPLADSLFVRCD